MKNSIMTILLISTLILSGCASTSTLPTTVENNLLITHTVPKLAIQVSDRFTYQTPINKNRQGTDSLGSLSTAGIINESYVFKDYITRNLLVITFVKFDGIATNWEMNDPDYSRHPGIISTGSTNLNGKPFLTGIYFRTEKKGWFVNKSYGRVVGPGNKMRLHITYIERVSTDSPTSEFIEKLSTKADDSFTFLSYSEAKQMQKDKREAYNEYLQQNADKKEGARCNDSLGCAKGYFCVQGECTLGFKK